MLGPFIGFAFIFSVISALDFPEQVRVIDTLDCFTDEQHYLFVFSNKVLEDGWQDWKFETVVGDDTTSALGTKRENYMTERLQNNLWSNEENPALGIQTSFEELIEYSQTTHIDWYSIFVASFIICIFIVVFVIAVHGYRKSMDEYNYVQMYPESIKNPEHYHLQCPNCSAPNTTLEDSCAYCGTVLLKVND